MSEEIIVDEKRLAGLAGELGIVYQRISEIKAELESVQMTIRNNWSDVAEEEFNNQYEKGLESIWDLLVAIDSMESFLQSAANGYTTADARVMSL